MIRRNLAIPSLTLVLIVAGVCLTAASQEATNVAEKAPNVAERIQRVENGLLPAVLIKGQTAGMKLAESMVHYKVPGLSVSTTCGSGWVESPDPPTGTHPLPQVILTSSAPHSAPTES